MTATTSSQTTFSLKLRSLHGTSNAVSFSSLTSASSTSSASSASSASRAPSAPSACSAPSAPSVILTNSKAQHELRHRYLSNIASKNYEYWR